MKTLAHEILCFSANKHKRAYTNIWRTKLHKTREQAGFLIITQCVFSETKTNINKIRDANFWNQHGMGIALSYLQFKWWPSKQCFTTSNKNKTWITKRGTKISVFHFSNSFVKDKQTNKQTTSHVRHHLVPIFTFLSLDFLLGPRFSYRHGEFFLSVL